MYPRNHRRGRRVPPVVSRKGRDDAQAQCDRCSHWVQRSSLREQLEFRGGTAPVGTGIFVCGHCYDVPNPLGALNVEVLRQDPIPVINPRPDQTTYDLTIPTYPSTLVPIAADQPPGTQIHVTGLAADPVLAYASGPDWLDFYTGALLDVQSELPQTTALVLAMTNSPSEARLNTINQFMLALVNAGVFANADLLYAMAAADAQAAGLNWVAPAQFALNPVSSPLFAADIGYAGTATGYLNTGLDVLAAAHFKQTSSSMSWYRATGGLSAAADTGISVPLLNVQATGPSGSPAVISARLGAATLSTTNASGTDPSLYCVSRSGSTMKFYQNGVLIGSVAIANQALHTATLLLLFVSGVPSTIPLSYGRFGAAMTDQQAAAEYAGLAAYLAAL